MDYSSYETIKIEMLENDTIMLLSLNRPASYNAVNHLMVKELGELWAKLKHDTKTRVVLYRV